MRYYAVLLALLASAFAQVDSVGPSFLPDSSIVHRPAQSIKFYLHSVFGESLYVVVWDDDRAGDGFDVFAARVTPGGTLLDSTPIAVGNSPKEDAAPMVAFDGANFLVVWYGGDFGARDIYGARVTSSGVLLDPGGFVISSAEEDQVL